MTSSLAYAEETFEDDKYGFKQFTDMYMESLDTIIMHAVLTDVVSATFVASGRENVEIKLVVDPLYTRQQVV
jgi:hypothetical protein